MSKEWLEKLEMEKQKFISKKENELADELSALDLRLNLLLKGLISNEQLKNISKEIEAVRI